MGLNVFSTTIFFIAILHVFLTNVFRKKAQAIEGTNRGFLYAFLGNVTLIFGLWLIPILVALAIFEGFSSSYQILTRVNFIEPFAYFVLLSIASIQPVRKLFDALMHRFFGKRLFVFWCGVILTSSVLTGIFSGIPIMALACWLLSSKFFKLRPSTKLSYCTIALLLIGISVGTTIIPLNYPFFMDAIRGDSSHWEMFVLFGWKALFALFLVTLFVGFLFRDEFQRLQKGYSRERKGTKITARELFYLLLFLLASIGRNQFYFLFFILCIVIILHKSIYRIKGEEGKLSLYLPLAVAFFTYTIEIHGDLQKWWVLPLFEQSEGIVSYFYSYFLTGLNEHVPLGALEEVWPTANVSTKFFAMLGVLAGGGLTIIAKSANILAKLELRKHFPHKTISPFYHLLIAIPIGLVVSILIAFLHSLGGL